MDITRTAKAVWTGHFETGKGSVSTGSGALFEALFSFGTRFAGEPGTNPEELMAAAAAAGYSMALSLAIHDEGFMVERIETSAACTVSRHDDGYVEISALSLEVRAAVPGLEDAILQRMADEAEAGCPVCALIRCNLPIERHVHLAPTE